MPQTWSLWIKRHLSQHHWQSYLSMLGRIHWKSLQRGNYPIFQSHLQCSKSKQSFLVVFRLFTLGLIFRAKIRICVMFFNLQNYFDVNFCHFDRQERDTLEESLDLAHCILFFIESFMKEL